jgi:hypothetical protein
MVRQVVVVEENPGCWDAVSKETTSFSSCLSQFAFDITPAFV